MLKTIFSSNTVICVNSLKKLKIIADVEERFKANGKTTGVVSSSLFRMNQELAGSGESNKQSDDRYLFGDNDHCQHQNRNILPNSTLILDKDIVNQVSLLKSETIYFCWDYPFGLS